MLTDNEHIRNLSSGEDFIDMISNKTSTFPDGTLNPLNGKFTPYGPAKMADAYQYIRLTVLSLDKDWNEEWYGSMLDMSKYTAFGSTSRNPVVYGSSSRIAVSADAFGDAEKIYVRMLLQSNCKKT